MAWVTGAESKDADVNRDMQVPLAEQQGVIQLVSQNTDIYSEEIHTDTSLIHWSNRMKYNIIRLVIFCYYSQSQHTQNSSFVFFIYSIYFELICPFLWVMWSYIGLIPFLEPSASSTFQIISIVLLLFFILFKIFYTILDSVKTFQTMNNQIS